MNIKINIFFVLAVLSFSRDICTQLSENNKPTNTTNVVVIEKEDKKSSHFFRNLIVCGLFFVAGYVIADSQNGIYVIFDGQNDEKIEPIEAYLYKVGIKKLKDNEVILKVFDSHNLDLALKQRFKSFFR